MRCPFLLFLPFYGWYDLDNDQDMELNGAKPDFIVLPQPKLIKATQRKP